MGSAEQTAPRSSPVLTYLTGYSDAYKQNHFGERVRDVGLTVETIETADPIDFLRFNYYHYAFNRAGGAKAGYNDIAVEAVDTVEVVDPDALWEEFTDTCAAREIGVNARVNKGAVQGVASLVAEHGNLFAWTAETVQETNSVRPVYTVVNDIRGFGEKITRFFIRDAVWITGVESLLPADERQLIQPMDVWTRRVAHVLWEDTWGASDTELSDRAAEACTQAGVSGAEFNQGAWYVGAKEHDGNTEAFVSDLLRVQNASE